MSTARMEAPRPRDVRYFYTYRVVSAATCPCGYAQQVRDSLRLPETPVLQILPIEEVTLPSSFT